METNNAIAAKEAAKKEMIAALIEVQRELKPAVKDAQNPHFKSAYADLGSVYEACRDALAKHGFAWTCETELGDPVILHSLLIHKSGEEISMSLPLLNTKKDMQGLGSALTYARRYSLMSLVGICPEDDDGNGASGKSTPPQQRQTPPAPKAPENRPSTKNTAGDWEKKPGWEKELCTEAQRKKLWAMAQEAGFNQATLKELIGHSMGVTSTKELTKGQIQQLFTELNEMTK